MSIASGTACDEEVESNEHTCLMGMTEAGYGRHDHQKKMPYMVGLKGQPLLVPTLAMPGAGC